MATRRFWSTEEELVYIKEELKNILYDMQHAEDDIQDHWINIIIRLKELLNIKE